MIDFNQYVAKRLLTGYVSLALDDLDDGNTVYYADMRRWLGSKYAEYEKAIDVDLMVAVSSKAEEWAQKRDDLMRRITLMINRKLIGEGLPQNEKTREIRRQFNIEAELLLETYAEFIEGSSDEEAFINYEDWTQSGWDEPYAHAQVIVEEFPLPRLKRRGENNEDQYRQHVQRGYLQELLDQLEGRQQEPVVPKEISPWLAKRRSRPLF